MNDYVGENEDMQSVSIDRLRACCEAVFSACNMTDENARLTADVYIRATLRGLGHHDISELPGRIKKIEDGEVEANPVFRRIAGFQAMESYDAGNGLGELCCVLGMERAMALADRFGIGLVAMRNTNHFLAGAPYTEIAAEKGYIGLILAKGGVSMGMTGAKQCMSALPMSFAYPAGEDYPVLLDACMAYASFGQLWQKAGTGEQVKPWWGCDSQGNPTTDPMELAKGVRYPIGQYKGFGLAMLGEVLTAVLSQGCVLDQEKSWDSGCTHPDAHTAIAIKTDALLSKEEFEAQTQYMSARARQLSGTDLHIPGDASRSKVQTAMETGNVALDAHVVDNLTRLGKKYGLELIL